MKYIDSEKLTAELKRKIGSIENCPFQLASFGEERKSEGELIAYKDALFLITSLQQEQPEVDLDAIVNEAFDKYSSVDGYGQLSVSFNRAELYSFIKKIARKEE